MKKFLFVLSTLVCALGAMMAETPVYLDDSKPVEERVEDALSRMTTAEKIAVIHAQSKFSSPGVPRLGIPEVWCTDGPHGIRPDDFNVYAVEFYPDSLVFSVNGSRTFAYPRVEALADRQQFPYIHPWYMLIDMQLGGSWVGAVDPKEVPVEMHIDWVRHYVRKRNR